VADAQIDYAVPDMREGRRARQRRSIFTPISRRRRHLDRCARPSHR